jgi:hypothetical protein
MGSRLSLFIAAMALTGVPSLNATGAWALTMQKCSAKYKAAQTAGTLNGKTWTSGKTSAARPPLLQQKSRRKKPKLRRRRTRATLYFQRHSHLRTPRSPLGRRGCTLVSTSTRPTRRREATAVLDGSKKAAATTVNATSD